MKNIVKPFAEYEKLAEARGAYIWNTKPKTLEDAEDPEIMTQGFGRLGLSQIKDKLVYGSKQFVKWAEDGNYCLLYTSPSPRDGLLSRMPSSA